MGASPEVIDKILSGAGSAPVELCLDEAELAAVRLFSRVQDQWRRDSGVITGLDIAGVEVVARILRIELDDELLYCIQVMANEAVSEFVSRDRDSRA